jgi:aminoglycoside 6'-N-acetyltransferase I
MHIEDLDAGDEQLLEHLAVLTHAAGARHAPRWLPTLDHAREEVEDATAPERITRVAFASDGEAVGWVSCWHDYGQVWELHPLLVAPAHHGRGIGSALVADIERIVASRGAGVLVVGTSDETNATSLGGVDLYRDPIAALANLTAAPEHAVGFWRRIGFALVGVTPDAEGPGMPTLHLAKRL